MKINFDAKKKEETYKRGDMIVIRDLTPNPHRSSLVHYIITEESYDHSLNRCKLFCIESNRIIGRYKGATIKDVVKKIQKDSRVEIVEHILGENLVISRG